MKTEQIVKDKTYFSSEALLAITFELFKKYIK